MRSNLFNFCLSTGVSTGGWAQPRGVRRWGRAVAIAGVMATMLSACAPSKVAQCRSLAEIARSTSEDTREAGSGRAEVMRQAADRLDRAAADLNRQWIADGQLKPLQGRFAAAYSDASRAAREFLNAVQSKDRALAEVSVQALEQAANEERLALQEIDRACAAPSAD